MTVKLARKARSHLARFGRRGIMPMLHECHKSQQQHREVMPVQAEDNPTCNALSER